MEKKLLLKLTFEFFKYKNLIPNLKTTFLHLKRLKTNYTLCKHDIHSIEFKSIFDESVNHFEVIFSCIQKQFIGRRGENISRNRFFASSLAFSCEKKRENSIFDLGREYKALGFICCFHTILRSPGLTLPLWVPSSSSKAAKTADLAKLPGRVVAGSAKLILQSDKKVKKW